MKSTSLLLIITQLASILFQTESNAKDDINQMKLTLNDIFETSIFDLNSISNIQWLEDGSGYFFTKSNNENDDIQTIDIYKYDISTDRESKIFSGNDFNLDGKLLPISNYVFTNENSHLLLTGKTKRIWRHSFYAAYYIYDSIHKKTTALANGAENLINARLSPNGRYVAYTQNHNLYVTNLTSFETRQLTKDGSDNILNGIFDWVYEEEIENTSAFEWSPNSQEIAFWRTDQTRVKPFALVDELPAYNKVTELKYPKAGEQNAIVSIGIVDIENGDTRWMETGKNDDNYLVRINWTRSANELCIQRLNRKQNDLEYLLADIHSGKTRKIAEETSPAWIEVTNDTHFFKNANKFVWTSEKSGYRHIYLTDYQYHKTRQLTNGQWEVSSVIGVDEKNNWVYFYGKKDGVIKQHIYRISLTEKNLKKISQNLGNYGGQFSPDYRYYIQSASSVDTPTQISLRNADGSLIRILEKNNLDVLTQYRLSYPEFIQLKTQDGTILNARITMPVNFNSQQKYPVIVYAYGGPASQTVRDTWPRNSESFDYWDFYLAQKGYILFRLDNRGTGGRGTQFKHYAYGDFSKWAVNDQIEGVKYLRNLPYVDDKKIGFWGKSFGGYMAGMLMTRAADYFSTGISLAMVSDYYNYDTIWTERYLGLPNDNHDGYEAVNVLNYTNKLKGHLLLIHGTGDDNVHVQNTFKWMENLIKHNKQFDLMLYPNRNHSLAGKHTRMHMFTLMTQYFDRFLK